VSPNLAPILTLCAAGVAALYALLVCLQALRAQQWPSVEGEIASTRLVRRYDEDGSTDYPYVAYRYHVAGKPYGVYYNPRNPADSVLHPSPNLFVWCILIAAIVFGASAVSALF